MATMMNSGKEAAGDNATGPGATAQAAVSLSEAEAIAMEHIKVMYRNVCRGIALTAAMLPILLFAFSQLCPSPALPGNKQTGSFSAFYNYACKADLEFYNGWGRTIFVGTLLIVGSFLILFPAYTRFQLWLKVSGVLAIAVALFPTGAEKNYWKNINLGWVQDIHSASAVILFLPIIILTLLPRFATYHLIKNKTLRTRLLRQYTVAGLVFILGGVCAIWLGGDRWVFWLEVVGVYGFAIYWWTRADEVLALADQEPK
jgi:hypothetical protein